MKNPVPIDAELYGGATEHTAENIIAVSGHMASMLAIHAFMQQQQQHARQRDHGVCQQNVHTSRLDAREVQYPCR